MIKGPTRSFSRNTRAGRRVVRGAGLPGPVRDHRTARHFVRVRDEVRDGMLELPVGTTEDLAPVSASSLNS